MAAEGYWHSPTPSPVPDKDSGARGGEDRRYVLAEREPEGEGWVRVESPLGLGAYFGEGGVGIRRWRMGEGGEVSD